ncbi:MAG: YHYH protein [Kiritimatiellia bacterium]
MTRACLPLLLLPLLPSATPAQDPRTDSWFTDFSGKYARIYQTDAEKTAGVGKTTWTNGTQTQSLPVYCGIQQVLSSASWVYIRTTGLASYTMGPWLNGSFPNLPKNQAVLYRFPRTTPNPVTTTTGRTRTGLGPIGYFVDGVAMFDSSDGQYWNGSTEVSGAGTGYWNRDAYVNEGATFDPAYAHQENSGTYHYHANPKALRHLLGDHVDYNAATKVYSESTAPVTGHSPILGWVRDGNPVYGPYGYSSALNAASAVTRMRSGYTLRNGANGADNLATTGRTTIPQWAVRAFGVAAAQSGPTVNTTYPLGRYMEDKAYRGDLGQTMGVDFDLDEFNGRYCVTPEFPGGVYAYFVSINADGTPAYPYNIGRAFRDSPTGSAPGSIAETVVTNFTAGAALDQVIESAAAPAGDDVTLVWSGLEGGTYQVEVSTNLTTWVALTSLAATTCSAKICLHRRAGQRRPRHWQDRPHGPGDLRYQRLRTGGGAVEPPLPPPAAARPADEHRHHDHHPPNLGHPAAARGAGPRLRHPRRNHRRQRDLLSRPRHRSDLHHPVRRHRRANVVVVFSPGPTYTLTGGFTITP